jgi:hypothetical protein
MEEVNTTNPSPYEEVEIGSWMGTHHAAREDTTLGEVGAGAAQICDRHRGH